jgi:hypothetical protein
MNDEARLIPPGVGWHACLDDLAAVASRLGERIRAAGDTESDADLAVKMFGAIMAAYLTHLWAEPDHPSFLPSVGYHQMYGWPNPDTVYRNAAIDGSGEYRLSGHRGSVPDVTIMPFGGPTAAGLRTFAPFDFDDLAIDDDGTFEVALSAASPGASVPNWWRLEPEMRTLMLRSVSEEWGVHVEPRVAIIRLDVDARRERVDAESLRRRFGSYAMVVEGMVASGLARVAQLRADDVVNRLAMVDYSGVHRQTTGGVLTRDGTCQAEQTVFGCAIGADVGIALPARGTADVDDPRVVAARHGFDDGTHAQETAGQVYLESLPPECEIRFSKWGSCRDSRIVNEYVNRPGMLLQCAESGGYTCLIANIGDDHNRFGRQSATGLVQGVPVATDQPELRPAC